MISWIQRIKKQGGMGLNLNKEIEDNTEFSNSDNNNINIEDKENTLKKKHRGSVANKGTETKEMALRRKLHELEKAPAPVLNIKGIKSMIQFNIHRFGKLARWSLTKDKRYYVKTFLQLLVIMLLIFLFFTEMVNTNEVPNPQYNTCCLAIVCVFGVTLIMGP